MKKEDNNLKREYLRKKQLELLAKGIECYQTQLDNAVNIDDIDDLVILEQIESLRELRDKHPRLTRSINDDLNVLMSQVNPTDIKQYNKVNFLIRNETENELINMLYFLSIFENAQLTQKQKQLLIDFMKGYSYEGNMKNFEFMCKKILKAKGGKCMSDNKRKFSAKELQKLFPSYYAKPNERYDEYLNISRKLDCYTASVEQSKIRMDKIRQLSLKTSIKPLELECKTSEEI